jgi:hypothetical protein
MYRLILLASIVNSLLWSGCRPPALTFPPVAAVETPATDAPVGGYDTDDNGRCDFFTFANGSGRIDRIGFAHAGNGGRPSAIIRLDDVRLDHARHLVIILDGIHFEVVRRFYAAGRLRMFYPPSRVVAPYPTMTDLSMEDILAYIPARGFESKFYNRIENRMSGGPSEYLEGFNQPYNTLLDYRSNLLLDGLGYLAPRAVFRKEINDLKRQFDRRQKQELVAYIVSTAGISTAFAEEGQFEVLDAVDRLVHQVMAETRGLVKVALLSDHGHSYHPAKRLDLEGFLEGRGWKLRDRIDEPCDVVAPAFGLVHFVGLSTSKPTELAEDMAEMEGAAVVSYAQGRDVIVLGPDGGRAVISRRGDSYRYAPQQGDPLKLGPLLDALESQADTDGYIDSQALLRATMDHVYPDALQRIHRAHFGLVEHPPDVIVSLEKEWFYGNKIFSALATLRSTHGGLDYSNSVTFIMSTIAPLGEVMRSREISEKLGEVTGEPFPLGR